MIEYRPMEREDIPVIEDLYAEYLNSGESVGAIIRDCWEAGSYLGSLAVKEGQIIGFLTVRPGIDFTYPHPELERELRSFVGDKPLAMCDSLLVLPEYRRGGIGHALGANMRQMLREKGYVYFLAEIWVYPDGKIPAESTFADMGKPVWQRLCHLFYTELGKYGMSCPVCGKDCVCGALVEILEL